jgi:hypothetical protein
VASLQATHRRGCGVGKAWTPATDDRLRGCTCEPTFYVVVRQGSAVKKERAGKNRREAERALRRVAVAEDAGTYEPVRNIAFTAWADAWLEGLESRTNAVRGYRSVMDRAKGALGQKLVRRVTVDDVRDLLVGMKADGPSDSTRAKHLRVLGACFASAAESAPLVHRW